MLLIPFWPQLASNLVAHLLALLLMMLLPLGHKGLSEAVVDYTPAAWGFESAVVLPSGFPIHR